MFSARCQRVATPLRHHSGKRNYKTMADKFTLSSTGNETKDTTGLIIPPCNNTSHSYLQPIKTVDKQFN